MEGAEESLGMCASTVPHLLRGPSGEACSPMSGREPSENAIEVARRGLERAQRLDQAGLYEDALLNLRVVEAMLPSIADHVALMRGELHERNGDFTRAALAYGEAVDASPSIELRAQARVGHVRSLLRGGAPDAEQALSALLSRYPQLPEAPALRFELAHHRELSGQLKSALSMYRAIDLSYPGYPMAADARERLTVLTGAGHALAPYTELELLARTERLIRSGPLEQARATVMELRMRSFSRAYAKQRDALVAQFDAFEQRRFARPESAPEDVPGDPAFDQLKKKLALPGGERQLDKLRPLQLSMYLEKAARFGTTDIADALVRVLVRRAATLPPDLRFSALTTALGSAHDEQVIALADSLLSTPSMAVPARYYRARALERAGRLDEARAELETVRALDTSPTRFYATWAAQRLREMAQPDACRAAGRAADCNRALIERTLRDLEAQVGVDAARAVERLAGVESLHGAAYPWLTRALALVRLGELTRASDELHETYLAWRFVARRGGLRAGRESVYRGAPITRAPLDMATHRARLALDAEARAQLAEVASALGDWGTAVNFGGLTFAEAHPYPYAGEVARAARKYGLDPDLLFAVMRVESVYQRRIISHAGAIGLMQIMPRTGRLIAEQIGVRASTATDLLDPRTNIEFSAWYFASLLGRMQGQLPLAIASYNGGPHNVRAWVRRYGAHIPLDAFLERIPFRETKRYVRRVLGYYASYKAQRGQSLDLMPTTLPSQDVPGTVSF